MQVNKPVRDSTSTPTGLVPCLFFLLLLRLIWMLRTGQLELSRTLLQKLFDTRVRLETGLGRGSGWAIGRAVISDAEHPPNAGGHVRRRESFV